MRRILVVALLIGAGVASFLLAPPPPSVETGDVPAPGAAGALGCVLRADRSGVVSVAAVGDSAEPVRLAGVAGGGITAEVVLDDLGAGTAVSSTDLGVSGILGGLVELDPASAAAGLLEAGPGGTAAAPCTPPATSRLVAPGGSTRSKEALTLVVFNPYAVDAVVGVRISSEEGTESVAGLESLFVPARTSITRDLARLVPLRVSLSVSLDVERGAVHAALLETGGSDTMIAEATSPSPLWWVLLPPYTTTPGRVVVVNADDVAVDVSLDTFGSGGAETGVRTETLAVGEQLSIPVGELGDGVQGAAVTGSGDLAVAVVFDGGGFRAGGGTAARLSTDWALGPSLDFSSVWVLVPGEIDATVEIEIPGSGGAPRTATATAGRLTQIAVPASPAGYLVRSSTDIVVAGTSLVGSTLAYATGSPLG